MSPINICCNQLHYSFLIKKRTINTVMNLVYPTNHMLLHGLYQDAKWIYLCHIGLSNLQLTRSTQRAQTSLAKADHYSHIVHCKNVEPWLWKTTHPPKKKKKKKKKVLDHYRQHDLGMLPLLRCFFAHLLILQYPDHHQNLISSYLYYSGPVHKISSQSVHNFLSNVVHRQTNRQTDKPTLPKT